MILQVQAKALERDDVVLIGGRPRWRVAYVEGKRRYDGVVLARCENLRYNPENPSYARDHKTQRWQEVGPLRTCRWDQHQRLTVRRESAAEGDADDQAHAEDQ